MMTTSSYLGSDHFLSMDHTRYSKSPALQDRRSKGYGMISTSSASESDGEDFTDNNNNNNTINHINNISNNGNNSSSNNNSINNISSNSISISNNNSLSSSYNNSSLSSSYNNSSNNSSFSSNNSYKISSSPNKTESNTNIISRNENESQHRVKSHSFGEKTMKPRANHVVFGGSLKLNDKQHPFIKELRKSPPNGYAVSQRETQNNDKVSKGRKYSHGSFTTIKEVNKIANEKQGKPDTKGRKHSLGNFTTNKASIQQDSTGKPDKPEKARKNSLSTVDQMKRKFSSGLFTRKKSTATSPDALRKQHQSQALRSSSLVSTSPDISSHRKHLKSPSSPLVTSPDMSRKHHPHPLKSNSSTAVSPRADDLRRLAMNHRTQNSHDESHRRSADSTFNSRKTRRSNHVVEAHRRSADSAYHSHNHNNKQCPSSTLLPHRERADQRKPFESCSNPDIVSTTPYDGKMKEYNVYCLGSTQTGKTALAVRYLTGRYIHEYTSLEDEIYTRVVKYGGERVNANITIRDADKIEQDIEMDGKSGIMIVFSVTDKASFKAAQALLSHLKALKLNNTVPVILVATKNDLTRQRKIPEKKTSDLAGRYNCTPFEVSAALDENVQSCFQQLFKQIEIRQMLRDGDEDDDRGLGSVLTAKRLSIQDYRESFTYSTIDSESDVSNDA